MQWFKNVEIPVLHESGTCSNSNMSSLGFYHFEDMDFLCVIALCDMLRVIL